MSPFKKIQSVKFFSRACVILFLLVTALIAIDKIVVPVSIFITGLSLIALPFISVMMWVYIERKKIDGAYTLLFIFTAIYFIYFGSIAAQIYCTSSRGRIVVFLVQIIGVALLLTVTEKFGRRLGGPPMKVVK